MYTVSKRIVANLRAMRDQIERMAQTRKPVRKPAIARSAVSVASERGLPPAQVSLAWLLSKPTVTAPIVGATKLSHIEDAVAATTVQLSEEEITRLEAPYRPHEVLPKG